VIISVDSDIAVHLIRGRADVRTRLDSAVADGAVLKMCTVVVHELVFGVLLRGRSRQLRELRALLLRLEVEAWTASDALAAAEIRADLAARGGGIGMADTMIAAQALRRGWAIATGNLRHFGQVRGLEIVDWTK
jgi:tRNA(fMet)-specific endonuclease VapC